MVLGRDFFDFSVFWSKFLAVSKFFGFWSECVVFSEGFFGFLVQILNCFKVFCWFLVKIFGCSMSFLFLLQI